MLDQIQAKKRVLITGGSGYIGSQVVAKLEENQVEYLSIDKLNPSSGRKLRFNLCNKEKTLQAIEEFKPNVVIHAGTHSANAYAKNFFPSFQEDFNGLSNILEALSKILDTRLVYFSSSYVYSGLEGEDNVGENSLLRPSHNFGIAKSFFEQFILKNHPNSVVFRLSSVFGPGNALSPNAIYNMISESLEKGQLSVWGLGTRRMQYIYIKDVVRFIERSIFLEAGIYNLGGDDYVSVADAAKIISQFL